MKKLIFFLFLSQLAIGQEQSVNTSSSHEFKFNALYLIVGAIEVSYEYNINEESSAGVSGLLSFDEDFGIENAFTGFYRFYFGDKPAAGFFAEGFGMVNTTEYSVYNPTATNDTSLKNTDFALGISVGGKFITKRGLVAEIYGGVGRNLGANTYEEFVPRFGITIGKRF